MSSDSDFVFILSGIFFIVRLFPLREPGVNYMASELTKKEIEVSVSQEARF